MFFNTERLISVLSPLKHYVACSKNKSVIFINSITAFSLLFYSFSIVTSGVEQTYDGVSVCITLAKWYRLVKLLVYVDVMLKIIIPFSLILISSLVIISKLMGAQSIFGLCNKKQNRGLKIIFRNCSSLPDNSYSVANTNELTAKGSMEPSVVFVNKSSIDLRRMTLANMNSSVNEERKATETSNKGYRMRFSVTSMPIRLRLKQKYAKTTGILITILIMFLLLNFPMAISKLKYLSTDEIDPLLFNLSSSTHGSSNQTLVSNGSHALQNNAKVSDIIMQRLACYLYFLNFSLNFFLYALSGSNFRSAMRRILSRFFHRIRN